MLLPDDGLAQLVAIRDAILDYLKKFDAATGDQATHDKYQGALEVINKTIETNAPKTNALPSNISASVGKKGVNNAEDVEAVQMAMNNFGYGLKVDGDCGPITKKAIVKFQKEEVGTKKPDGRVDPGGKTWRTMTKNALAVEEDTPPVTDEKPTEDDKPTTPPVTDEKPKEEAPPNLGDETPGYTQPEPISELNGKKANLNGLSSDVGEDLKGAKYNKFEDVLAVQYYLNKLGYACPQDGKMDNRMGRQIIWFAKRCKLANPDVPASRTVKKDSLVWDFLIGKYALPDVDQVSDGYFDLEVTEENLKPATQLTKDIGVQDSNFKHSWKKNYSINGVLMVSKKMALGDKMKLFVPQIFKVKWASSKRVSWMLPKHGNFLLVKRKLKK